MKSYSRRHFLKLGTQTIAGAGLALGADPMLTLAHAADARLHDTNDYRALVCVYLDGGCDGFSLMGFTWRTRHTAQPITGPARRCRTDWFAP